MSEPSYDYSGQNIAKAMLNSSVGWFPKGRTGSHFILKWEPPESHDTEPRTVSVPLNDHIPIGTLRGIAEDAGANDVDAFCLWIEDNC